MQSTLNDEICCVSKVSSPCIMGGSGAARGNPDNYLENMEPPHGRP